MSCRGAGSLVEDLFGPLGYEVETATDPEEGRPPYRNVRLPRRRRSPSC